MIEQFQTDFQIPRYWEIFNLDIHVKDVSKCNDAEIMSLPQSITAVGLRITLLVISCSLSSRAHSCSGLTCIHFLCKPLSLGEQSFIISEFFQSPSTP
jgi:hypothetical protein